MTHATAGASPNVSDDCPLRSSRPHLTIDFTSTCMLGLLHNRIGNCRCLTNICRRPNVAFISIFLLLVPQIDQRENCCLPSQRLGRLVHDDARVEQPCKALKTVSTVAPSKTGCMLIQYFWDFPLPMGAHGESRGNAMPPVGSPTESLVGSDGRYNAFHGNSHANPNAFVWRTTTSITSTWHEQRKCSLPREALQKQP